MASVAPSGEKATNIPEADAVPSPTIVAITRREFVFQSLTTFLIFSKPIAARVRPSGEKATPSTESPSSVISAAILRLLTDQSRTGILAPALARIFPSGENARLVTALPCPPRRSAALRESADHRLIFPSSPLVAKSLPSGEKVTALTD
jgi:hypothetical protein